jgi:molybdopterin converting factor small subunit
MRVRVLYFAAVRDLVTVRDFTAWIASRHGALVGRMASVRIARNETFALGDEALAEGDVLALIPPVAGG